MKSETKRKTIHIKITTYKHHEIHQGHKMEERGNKTHNRHHNKYVCAICLSPKTEEIPKRNDCCKKIHKSCPICQKGKDCCGNKKDKPVPEKERCGQVMTEKETTTSVKLPNFKTVQTSDSNVAQGLSLLNEVLTVFQTKKVDINKDKVKCGLAKDVAVSTDDIVIKESSEEKNPKDKAKLTVSTFQYSIDATKKFGDNEKFIVVNCSQPDFVKKQYSRDLIKHKSSSIPQMKLEELKYSIKQKTRSKDAIEEVNRMFATVNRSSKTSENSNRPMVRNGPRVLPVVKNMNNRENHTQSSFEQSRIKKDCGSNCDNCHSCKHCQTCLSSGDSFVNTECRHDADKQNCDKCVYMLCCHYENKRKMQSGVLICEHCRDLNEEHYCEHCNYDVDDSG